MLLKSVELQGYKTFAGRTNFEFAGAITCIVGPNGSGKSNIADAIRWVLGEQSFRLLRGKKTEDMIFSGSEQRPRAGMASASIIFDNSSGWLPVDFSEVAISRRAYRDGTNEYLLNGQRVRLKDISELLGNSGLSERTYTIIGQGLVDAALALRAEERRGLFEEAAGIGLYRARREEALRRLETTRRNLERVEDILAELKPRLRSLERQARRAEQYDQVNADLRLLLREYYGFHWFRAQRELNAAREDAQVQQSMLEVVRKEQEDLDQKLTASREQIQGLRARLGSWHRELSQLHSNRETSSRDLAVSDERLRSLMIQQQNAKDEFARLEQQIVVLKERLSETDQESNKIEEELNEARLQMDEANRAMQSRQAAREDAEKKIRDLSEKLSTLTNRQASLQTQLTERHSRTERQQAALDAAEQETTKADLELRDIEHRLKAAEQARDKIIATRKKDEDALQAHRQKIVTTEAKRKSISDEQSKLRTDLVRAKAQLDVLEQADRALAGYASGTRLLLNSAKDGKLSGLQGALSSHLDVPEELETAIAAALGEYLDAVLIETGESSEGALEILLEEATRGALLPLKSLIPPEPIKPIERDGIIGLASDLVKVSPNLRPAVDLLLGHCIIIRNKTVASQALAGQPLTARAVTLRGEVFYASGPVIAGQGGQSGTLSRPRQRRELQTQVKDIEKHIAKITDQLKNLDVNLENIHLEEKQLLKQQENTLRQEREAIVVLNQIALEQERVKRQNEWQRSQRDSLREAINQGEKESHEISGLLSRIGVEITQSQDQLRKLQSTLIDLSLEEFQAQMSYWNTQAAVAERALVDVQNRRKEREIAIQEASQTKDQLRNRLITIEGEITEIDDRKNDLRSQEGGIAERIETLRGLIEPAEAEVENWERQQDELQKTEAKARQALSVADRRYAQSQLTFTRKQEMLDHLHERIEDDLGLVSLEYEAEISGPNPLPFGEMVEQLVAVAELPEGLDESIKRQRLQLRRMGAINPEAQAEYKEVKERFNFMTAQVADLVNAEKDMKEVISELDTLMEREFRKTFDAVAGEFREIFTRLFGGGSARLVLTDPDNLTDTGIDIEARLPGRRTQGLSLLSGGERSLTAAALVFSLLKVSPTPFCVLDEVDAMLDEANVGRFRDLLRELAENTQFIVITHNRNTVQAADVIYGVTMGRDSVSQMISLKLDEVADVVNNS